MSSMARIATLNRLLPSWLPIAMSSARRRKANSVTAISGSVVMKAMKSVPTKLRLQPII